MRIASVEAIPYRLPVRRPVKFANGEVNAAEHVLIRVRTTDGATGIAEATPRPMTYGDTAVSVVDAINNLVSPLICGTDASLIEAVHHRLRNIIHNPTALAALDVALWDLKARCAGIPLASMLGGFSNEVVAAHLLSLGSPAEMAAEAEAVAAETGVTAMKVKVGVDVATDVDRTVAVHKTLGPGAHIYLDANHGWNATQTLEVVRQLDRHGVAPAWIEEPTPAADALQRRWLVDRLEIPVVGDESVTTLADAATELQAGRCQRISIKPGRTGMRTSARLIGFATGIGADVVVGSQIEGTLGSIANLHLAAGFEAAARHPAEVTSMRNFEADIVADAPAVINGVMRLPDGPGLGVDVDEAALSALRIDS